MRKDRPTAIATGGDGSLPGVLAGIESVGLGIGTDVSLVTSDPGELGAVFRPPLAAIVRDGAAIGRMAAELLLERIADPTLQPRTVTIPARFESRASVGPPPTKVTRGTDAPARRSS